MRFWGFVGVVAVALLSIAAMFVPDAVVRVVEGHVGVIYRFGRLRDDLLDPGYHTVFPVATEVVQVPVVVRTDVIPNVECGTASGVTVVFDRIEVVHRLLRSRVLPTLREYGPTFTTTCIHDRVRAVVNQICSREELEDIYIRRFDEVDELIMTQLKAVVAEWAPGLELVAVRVTKPSLPEAVRANYMRIESLRSQLEIVQQKQLNDLKQADTIRRREVMEAEKGLQMTRYRVERELKNQEAARQIATIEADMFRRRAEIEANATAYNIQQQARVNKLRLTREYLQSLRAERTFANTRMFLGDRVPDAVFEEVEEPAARDSSLHASERKIPWKKL